jgi:hypothetical protein
MLPATFSPQLGGLITRAVLVLSNTPGLGRNRSLLGTTHYRKPELTLIKRQQVLEDAYAADLNGSLKVHQLYRHCHRPS